MKRLFVAITFDTAFKQYICQIQDEVVKASEKGKFHPMDNLHLTIEFIGMVPDKLIGPMWQSIVDHLSNIENLKPFELQASHLGYFQKKNKKIPWIGVEAPSILNEIQRATAIGVAAVIDHVVDHTYVPHITLGRQVVIDDLPEVRIDYTYKVRAICLMESSSASGRLTYRPIEEFSLSDKELTYREK